jgi:hypothetical protein
MTGKRNADPLAAFAKRVRKELSVKSDVSYRHEKSIVDSAVDRLRLCRVLDVTIQNGDYEIHAVELGKRASNWHHFKLNMAHRIIVWFTRTITTVRICTVGDNYNYGGASSPRLVTDNLDFEADSVVMNGEQCVITFAGSKIPVTYTGFVDVKRATTKALKQAMGKVSKERG